MIDQSQTVNDNVSVYPPIIVTTVPSMDFSLNILQETRYSNGKIMNPATVQCFCGIGLYKKEESCLDDTIRS